MRTSIHFALRAASIAAIASGLQAQSVETKSNMGVFARTASSAVLKFVKSGTKLALPASETAALRQATATTRVAALRSTSGVSFVVNEVAKLDVANSSAGTSASSDSKNIAPGAHSFLIRFPANEGAKFVVVATVQGRLVGRASALGSVDIDNDGKIDWSAKAAPTPVSMRWLVTAGKTGLAFGLESQALATVGSTFVGTAYQSTVQLTVSPASSSARCLLSRVGTSCGPVLSARETAGASGQALEFMTSRAQAGGLALFILGDKALSVRFPGTRCGLFTNPLVIFGRQVSRTGTAGIRFAIPKDFAGKFIGQDIVLSRSAAGYSVESTNAIGVACRKG